MQSTVIKQVNLVNEGQVTTCDVYIKGDRIEKIGQAINPKENCTEILAEGLYLFPGVIDDQVHFREPGLTTKADIFSESRAAVAGGVTSFMEMPNTKPPAFTQTLLEEKYQIAAQKSIANYSFFMGTSTDNYDEVMRTNDKRHDVCGVKIFMGSSTGNLLVDNPLVLDRIFGNCEVLIATHCEEERLIQENLHQLKQHKQHIQPSDHPIIRNEEVCFESSLKAIQYAKKHGTRLHILHITTEKELALFSNMLPLHKKQITAEVCVHHLHFTANDYDTLGNKIKCNPAIKAAHNKEALWKALLDNTIDVIATDHAPHLLSEKGDEYEHAHAGLPLVQHGLQLMLHYHKQGRITLPQIADKMSHSVATCFNLRERGFVREGYFADLVLVNLNEEYVVNKQNLLYKCQWSPFEGFAFDASINTTWVNGQQVFSNGQIIEGTNGKRLQFY